jgi:diguanylate cyclase (GGDEF)-like protein
MMLGPLGVLLNSYALATTTGSNDGAVIFALPVLWQALFFGRRGAFGILCCVAVGDGLALIHLGHGLGYPERWVDVMVATSSVATVVLGLQARNARLVERLAGEARIDPLTGLLNRRGFDERTAAELARLHRNPQPFAVVTFDIDHFKRVNDRFGHDVGDQVLRHIGRLVRGMARDADVLARFGGEEFVVLLPDADADGAEAYAERVRRALALDTGELPAVSLSAGVCQGCLDTDPTTLIARADAALYEAKRAGRDRTRVFAHARAHAIAA